MLVLSCCTLPWAPASASALPTRRIFHPGAIGQAGAGHRNPVAAAQCLAAASSRAVSEINHPAPAGPSHPSTILGQEQQIVVERAPLPVLRTSTELIAPASLRWRHSPFIVCHSPCNTDTNGSSVNTQLYSSLRPTPSTYLAPMVLGTTSTFSSREVLAWHPFHLAWLLWEDAPALLPWLAGSPWLLHDLVNPAGMRNASISTAHCFKD